MDRDLGERRRHPRIVRAATADDAALASSDAVAVNLSPGGACLRLRQPPSKDAGVLLQFTVEGQEFVLPSRLAWSRIEVPEPAHDGDAAAASWLAGFAFVGDEAGTLIAVFPHEALAACELAVDVLPDRRAMAAAELETEAPPQDGSLVTFSEHSVRSVKAAANELLPVLAKHFTDVRMVFTRDRLEISAPFRAPADAPEARRPSARRIESPRAPAPEAPVVVDSPPPAASPRRPRALVAGAVLAAVLVGIVVLAKHRTPDAARSSAAVAAPAQKIPAWAAGLDRGTLAGWLAIKKQYGLSDATLRSTLGVLRANDYYSPGQSLYDLTQYPAQVKRAFALLAGAHFHFGPLETDLKGRLVSGARFPDEPPGGPYSSLEPASFHNVVVLATISLLHRDRAKPAVQALLAALKRSGG